MTVEIISIGNEVLAGFTTNTNAAYLSQELSKLGFAVVRHTVLPDKEEALRQGFLESMDRVPLVVATGGLGPTCDDITRKVAAELFHSKFRYASSLAEELRGRFGPLPTIDDQATVPTKARVLRNSVGTAPGLIFRTQSSQLILLPGVPVEMKTMFTNQVIPYLRDNVSLSKIRHSQHLHLFDLFEVDVDPLLRKLQEKYPNIEFGIYPSPGFLSIHLTTDAPSISAAKKLLDPPIKELLNQFSSYRFESTSGKIEEAIHQKFIQKGLTLSIAESITGGSVAARLIRLPGASQYFLGSIVAYSDDMKKDILGISEKLLRSKGAVSAEVVEQMAKNVLSKTKSDYSIAVSGIAGPSGGTSKKPVGTVWFAVYAPDKKPQVWKIHAVGNREVIIERSINALLSGLLRYINE